MGTYVGGRRRGTTLERRGRWARAYVPGAIAHQSFSLCRATTQALEEAALAISAFDRAVAAMPGGTAFAHRLLCAEALAVIAAAGGLETPFTVDALTGMHARLFEGSADADYGGRLRRQSRRCAGNGALGGFVPPPGKHVGPLLEDLCRFATRTDLPPALQAAIGYAQFRTIRPFLDGNARMARALVHAILRRRGLATHAVVPVSVVFGADAHACESALDDYRFEGAYETGSNAARVNDWIATFAGAARAAVQRAGTLAVGAGQ